MNVKKWEYKTLSGTVAEVEQALNNLTDADREIAGVAGYGATDAPGLTVILKKKANNPLAGMTGTGGTRTG